MQDAVRRGLGSQADTETDTSDRFVTLDELEGLGWELNTNQYRVVGLAARYDDERAWLDQGLSNPALGIAHRLGIHTSTAREWIRVGHSLRHFPLIDAAFAANHISYAQARILTRWVDDHNEQQLLDLAALHPANRLSTAIARALAVHEDDDERDQRHHADRSVTSHTDGDGMVVIRVVLPPPTAKPILAAIDTLVQQIANTPTDPDPSDPDIDTELEDVEDVGVTGRASADAPVTQSVTIDPDPTTVGDHDASADASHHHPSLATTLRELTRRWCPAGTDDAFPTLAQQRADALTVLFLHTGVHVTTEVVIHVRGDGSTFDDGTPITTNAIGRQLDAAFIRLLLHDTQRHPIDASHRRRHPTTRQARVVLEAHHHRCIDCGTTELLELDHNPPYQHSRRTITTELEPRCAPCHRARHRTNAGPTP